ncbi:MAG: DUF3880 domain-containing protein [bacterium]|nr:DUF3880 domain-containing protein [bacterium]
MRPDQWTIERFPASDGTPTVRVNGKLLHSKFNPLREAERWAANVPDCKTIVVIGAGLGYGVATLREKQPNATIVVLEPVDKFVTELQQRFSAGNIRVFSLARRIDATKITDDIFAASGNDVTIIEGYPEASKWDNSGIVARLQFRKTLRQQPPRVLVISPIYGGSYPMALYCTNALRELGCTVELLDNALLDPIRKEIDAITQRAEHQQQLTALLVQFAAERITALAAEFRPDLVLALAQAPVSGSVWQELRASGIATAFWFVEDYRLFPYFKAVAPAVDYFFTIQRGEWCHELTKAGAYVHYLPAAADPSIHHRQELSAPEIEQYGSEVSFVGAGYYNRRNAFLSLLDLDFKIWGDGWKGADSLQHAVQESGRRIATDEAVKIFSATKVNINLHSSTYHETINPDGDFVNPRTFELAACGAYQVLDRRSLLPELFTGGEIDPVTTIEQFRQRISDVLIDDTIRTREADLALKRVMHDHCYTHRMEELLGVVFAQKTPVSHREPGQLYLKQWLEQSKDDPELNQYLKRFQARKQITIADIADEIEHRHEELSSTEAVLMLIHEFYRWGKERGVI